MNYDKINFFQQDTLMFQNAIVRTPSFSMVNGLTTSATLGKPNFELALIQHQNYINALKSCMVEVTILPAIETFPDSCFVEDVAVLTETFALLTRPNAPSRQGEVEAIKDIVKAFYKKNIYQINAPGTLEAGDVLRVNNHFFIGLSARTNEDGALQMKTIMLEHGFTVSIIPLKDFLHLKTGVSYIGQGHLLVQGELINHPAFAQMKQLIVNPYESYAANCILVNDTVLMPQGYPKTHQVVTQLGISVLEIDMSEFRKIDGGLSCLSLRF